MDEDLAARGDPAAADRWFRKLLASFVGSTLDDFVAKRLDTKRLPSESDDSFRMHAYEVYKSLNYGPLLIAIAQAEEAEKL